MKVSSGLFLPTVLVVVCLVMSAAAHGAGLGAHRHQPGQARIRLAAADFKPVGADPQNAGAEGDVRRHALQRPGAMRASSTWFRRAWRRRRCRARRRRSTWRSGPRRPPTRPWWPSARFRRPMGGWWSTAGSTTRATRPIRRCWASSTTRRPARIWRAPLRTGSPTRSSARLGGGINGIAETKIYFVSSRTGTKEIWVMDYDGQNQHQVTHLGSISLSPRISPDNTRLAFASLGREGWSIRMYSLELGRMVSFPAGTAGGSNQSPAWSADGTKIAFSSSRSGDPEIWVADASGGNLHKLTAFRGPDVAPTWNPRTNAQIAWVSGRTGEPQIYIMDQDGSNVQRMTDGGYAISPSWSPNGGTAHLQLESQIRAGRSRRAGHLRDGHCQQALAAAHARCGQQRLSLAGRRTDGISCSSAPSGDTARSGRCWPTAPSSIN